MIVRPASHEDITAIVRIIAYYASQGLMLPRSRAALVSALSGYVVADLHGVVVGCGGLLAYSAGSAEIYGLATAPENSPQGTGRAIVEALIERAREERMSQVFALTLAPGFFRKMGFRIVEQKHLKLKVWTDCVACPKFGNCDEIAMVLDLN